MERKSLGWIWAGVGLLAVLVLIGSGLRRRPRLELAPVTNPAQPIIVEPISPNPAAPLPASLGPSEGAASPTTESLSPEAVADAAPLPSEGPERIRRIQQALLVAGYNPGPVDGKMGRLTQKAIRDFQEAQGLSVDGKVGPKTWSRLEPYLRTATSTTTAHD